MHRLDAPDAIIIAAKRDAGGGWDPKGDQSTSFTEKKKEMMECPGGLVAGPDQLDTPEGDSDLPEAKRPGEGTECPVCRTRTVIEYWVDDKSWADSGLPDRTCIDCFNQYGPDQAELRGLYARGSLMSFEAEKDDKDSEA